MNLPTRTWVRPALALCLAGLSFGLIFLTIPPVAADTPPDLPNRSNPSNAGAATGEVSGQDTAPPVFPANPLITPTNGVTLTTLRPVFDWADATDADGVISYTLLITGQTVFSDTAFESVYTPAQSLSSGRYTWTVRAYDTVGNAGVYVSPPQTFTIASLYQIYIPLVQYVKNDCPVTSGNSYELIPIDGNPADRPGPLHADLNLSLRGYIPTGAALGLVDYAGGTAPDPPQLAGLFGPNRFPGISAVYQVYDWIWNCGAYGCPGSPVTNPEVTLAGLRTTPGEALYIPERGSSIWGSYQAMVLYAEEKRLTLAYTRQDTVAPGYTVHFENVCVDPNLLALYQAQTDAAGWHITGQLPALRNDQPVGTAFSSELRIAIRDKGTFLDPRSRKDWWHGY